MSQLTAPAEVLNKILGPLQQSVSAGDTVRVTIDGHDIDVLAE
ncbi:MAG: hypothetical protein ACTHQ3_01635 [Motilibacteraceae bacterium]